MRTVHPSLKPVPGRSRRPGTPVRLTRGAWRYRLRLLPPGSDLVHGRPPHGTWPSTPSTGVLTPKAQPREREFSLARADCECRAPLPPRLARSVVNLSAELGIPTAVAKGIGLILIGLALFLLSRPYMEIAAGEDVPPPPPRWAPLKHK